MTPRVKTSLTVILAVALGLAAGLWIGRALEAGLQPPSAPTPSGTFFEHRRRSKPLPPPTDFESTVNRFHQIWYESGTSWADNQWLGIPTMQNPMDAWVVQEIIAETRPDVIVEAGSFHGGSAALWAMILEQVNPAGRVVTIDIKDMMVRARQLPVVQERVDFLLGSSTEPRIVQEVARRVQGKKALVILDSLHTRDHVLDELRAYSPFVPVGGYLIVQDTNINGHPIYPPPLGPGPYEAVEDFLKENPGFEVDKSRERLLLTFSPGGYLKRVK